MTKRIAEKGASKACFDHTLITPWDSIGLYAQIKRVCICLKSTTWEQIGVHRTARNGFDSRLGYIFPFAIPWK
jgi:hypothetical protein